jgi:hypothetical protein
VLANALLRCDEEATADDLDHGYNCGKANQKAIEVVEEVCNTVWLAWVNVLRQSRDRRYRYEPGRGLRESSHGDNEKHE